MIAPCRQVGKRDIPESYRERGSASCLLTGFKFRLTRRLVGLRKQHYG
ncbi:hypothetical protein RHECNPAF_1760047 [Rhizobium etli CNPAF512]|nr:hypothetical protein RHECNPAF_1760047 [Rhizobium etli CNPAF512]